MSALDAIADPVRLRVVRHLARVPSATLPELADAVEVHLNTVRPHVGALVAARAVVREPEAPTGRGRPRIAYRLAGDWSPPTSDYRGLAELLAGTLVRGRRGRARLRRIGFEWGRDARQGSREDGARELPRVLERLGFGARVNGSRLELSLCPCPLVAPDEPGLLCDLAAAVVDGALSAGGAGVAVTGREHDPQRRTCRLRL
jgi:predicted ArsR family transcriptional regulator